MKYTFTYKGITSELPVYEVSGGLKIAYLDSFCDIELVNAISVDMADKISSNPEFLSADRVVILTAVTKGVPFAYVVANLLMGKCNGKKVELAIARKENKVFYGKVVSVDKISITSCDGSDLLVLAENDVKKLDGAATIILDDMYSTGASIEALEKLAQKCKAKIIDRIVAVWETGDESKLPPVKYCAVMPLMK